MVKLIHRVSRVSIVLAALVFASHARADGTVGETDTTTIDAERAPSGTATLASSVSPGGAARQRLAVQLPPSRAGLPLPLAVLYDGTFRVGSAGVGWDVPLAYVERSDTLSRRKPATGVAGTPLPAERVFLHLGDGGSVLMVGTDMKGTTDNRPTVYRAFSAAGYGELRVVKGGAWEYRPGNGVSFFFQPLTGARDSSRAYLTGIADAGGQNRVALTYDIVDITPPQRPGAGTTPAGFFQEIVLRTLDYNFNSSFTCARDQVRLDYQLSGPSGVPVAFYVDEAHVRIRQRVLTAISVWEHESEACSSADSERLRAYELSYQPDADSGLPRLTKVDVRGAGAAPFSSGQRLPLARYNYGRVTQPDGALQYDDTTITELPALPPIMAGAFEGSITNNFVSQVRVMSFTDMTGDGLPDLFYPNTDLFHAHPDVFHMAHNRPIGATGTSLVGDLLAPNNTLNTVQPMGWATQDKNAQHLANQPLGWSSVTMSTTALVDMNGDGLPDLVFADGGHNPSGKLDPNYWMVRLYKPQAQTAELPYVDVNLDVSRLRQELLSRGHFNIAPVNPDHYLPVSQSQTTLSSSNLRCNDYVFLNGQWVKGSCPVTPQPQIARNGTVIEWKLADVNGDHLPDFVFNSEPLQVVLEQPCPVTCESPIPDTSGVPFGCEGACENRIAFDLPKNNKLLVFYNDGAILRAAAGAPGPVWGAANQAPTLLRADGACGVERTIAQDLYNDSPHDHAQFFGCGFSDVNGDGAADYVIATENFIGGAHEETNVPGFGVLNGYRHAAVLGSGLPQAAAEVGSQFLYGTTYAQSEAARTVPLPGPVDLTINGEYACRANPNASFQIRQITALRDLTGDGIADYVFWGTWDNGPNGPILHTAAPLDGESTAGRAWWVMVGTGVSFRAPALIKVASGQTFGIYQSDQVCGMQSRVTIALKDLDGDGILDLLNLGSDGKLRVVHLRDGATGGAGAITGGRLVSVDNGVGSTMRYTYGSAKRDTASTHLVPRPEIVVTAVQRSSSQGGSFDEVRFAYGGAEQVYHPLLGQWIFPGYARRVTVSGTTGPNGFVGQASVDDQWKLADAGSGAERFSIIGQRRAHYFLAGVTNANPWALIATPATRMSVFSGHTLAWKVHALPPMSGAPALTEDCVDGKPLTDAPVGDAQLCRRNGVLLESERYHWEGGAASSAHVLETRTTLVAEDNLGRPTKIRHSNDLAIADDDTCDDITWAQETQNDRVLTTAVSIMRTGDCTKFLRVTRYRYDNLSQGSVGIGFISDVNVERRRVSDGALLDDIALEHRTPDAFGNSQLVESTRPDGTTNTLQTTYDAFGVRERVRTSSASDVGGVQLVTRLDYDAAARAYTYTDAQGLAWRTLLDPFGRVVRQSVVDGGAETVLAENSYVDDPAAPGGRSIGARVYFVHEGSAVSKDSRIYIDDLGRTRYSEEALGGDYGNAVLRGEEVDYDAHGRKRFVADPHLPGEPAPHYGTSYLYGSDGRLSCAVRGIGYQTATTTNSTTDTYPTCTSYSYLNHKLFVRRQDAAQLSVGSSSAGMAEQLQVSAIGRVLSQVKQTSAGVALERADYTYDRLGNRVSVSRFMDPNNSSSVQARWDYGYDSRGAILSAKEAGGALESRSYDVWGHVIEVGWTAPNGTALAEGIRYKYDGFGRRYVEDLTGTGGAVTRHVEYHYDHAAPDGRHVSPTHLAGRLAWVGAPTRTTYFGYDRFGNPSAVSRADTDDSAGRLFTELRDYDSGGELRRLTFLLPDTQYEPEVATYEYDSARRLRAVGWESGGASTGLFTAQQIDTLGRYRDVRYGNGAQEKWSYRADRRQELQSWVVKDAQAAISSRAYEGYDPDGRLTASTEVLDGVTRHRAFTYDPLGRIQHVVSTPQGPGPASEDDTFSYDALGNLVQRFSQAGILSRKRTFTTAVGDPDRVCRAESTVGNGAPQPATQGCTHSYDAHGNVIQLADGGATRQFAYQPDGHVSAMSSNGVNGQVLYDGLGVVARMSIGGGVSDNRDDRRFGALIEESTFEGGTGKRLERRIPGPFGVLASQRGIGAEAVTLYRHGDGRGTQQVTDGRGTTVQQLRYSAFGQVMDDSGVPGDIVDTKYQWNGGDALAAFGVDHVGARLYDPSSGRFLQRDPLATLRGGSESNPYSFALNDPIDYADPTGFDISDAAKGWVAHRLIAAYYVSHHPGEYVTTNYISIGTIARTLGVDSPLVDAVSRMKPDIMNAGFSLTSGMFGPVYIYEIKPANKNGYRDAANEIKQYQRGMNLNGLDDVELGPSSDLGVMGEFALGDDLLVFWSPSPGIVVYEWIDLRRQESEEEEEAGKHHDARVELKDANLAHVSFDESGRCYDATGAEIYDSEGYRVYAKGQAPDPSFTQINPLSPLDVVPGGTVNPTWGGASQATPSDLPFGDFVPAF